MTRYKDTCTLIGKTYGVDSEGVPTETQTRFKAFCNSYTIATQAWATARLANYDADEEIQLRSCDYHGEPDVVYRGRAYSVIQRMDQGDFTRLILQRKKPDVGEENEPTADETTDGGDEDV